MYKSQSKSFRVWYYGTYGVAVVRISAMDREHAIKKFRSSYRNKKIYHVERGLKITPNTKKNYRF